MRKPKLEKLFGMGDGYTTLRTHIKLKGGVSPLPGGDFSRIEVLGPQGYDNFLVCGDRELNDLLRQSGFQEYGKLRGMPVLAIYHSEKLVGIRKREIPEY